MLNITAIPSSRVPFLDSRTGLISREWFLFFQNLFVLIGSGRNENSLEDLQLGPLPQNPDVVGQIDGIQVGVSPNNDSRDQVTEVMDAVNGLLAGYDSRLVSRLAVIDQAVMDLELRPLLTPATRQASYGVFHDTTTQTAAAINTAYAVTLNTSELLGGVTLGALTSQVIVHRTGIYNFQFSLQLNKASSTAKNVWIWADIDGTSVPYSATEVTLAGSSSATVVAWNFVLEMAAGSYFRLMWATDDTGCQITALPAVAPVPGIPSVILTVTDNIRPFQD